MIFHGKLGFVQQNMNNKRPILHCKFTESSHIWKSSSSCSEILGSLTNASNFSQNPSSRLEWLQQMFEKTVTLQWGRKFSVPCSTPCNHLSDLYDCTDTSSKIRSHIQKLSDFTAVREYIPRKPRSFLRRRPFSNFKSYSDYRLTAIIVWKIWSKSAYVKEF